MNILWDNKILDATISSDNESVSYPASALKSVFLHEKYQAIGNSDTISIVFDGTVSVNCIFFGYTNMSSMTVHLWDSSNTELESIQFGADGSVMQYYGYGLSNFYGYDDQLYGYYARKGTTVYDPIAWYMTQTYDVAKITIDIVSEDSYVYLGGFATGKCIDMGNPSDGWTDDFDDKSIVSESDAGQVLQDYVTPLRVYKFTLDGKSRKEAKEAELLYRTYGVGVHLWCDLFPENHEFMIPIYCTLTDSMTPKKDGNNWKYDIEIKEAR